MKYLALLLIVLLIVMPVLAQDATSPVEPQSKYDATVVALISVIAFLASLSAFLGHKVSSLVPPELVGLSLRLTDMTTSKTDDQKVLEFWVNQGYNAQKVNGVWVVTPPVVNTVSVGETTTTTTTGVVSPDVTPISKV